jgi:class 3 adenylate cyclase
VKAEPARRCTVADDRPGPAELRAAGLYDPDADDASGRLALFEYLIGLGATLDDLLAAEKDGFPVIASNLALWKDRERLTLDEAAQAAGVDHELIARTWRAAGFPEPDPDPDARMFLRRDVEILTGMRAGIEFFGEDVTIQLIRVLGAAAARVADASVTAFVVNVVPQAIEGDASGLELARANAESIVLLDALTSGFDTLLRHHIERGFRPMAMLEGSAGIDLVHGSVGFVDLVDSTAWTQRLDLPALSRALSMFDATASEIVVLHGGRAVKLIGDSVMFIATAPEAAVDIGLALVDAFSRHEVLPQVRVGIATGDVLARDGDFSGSVVNLAARAVNVAYPSSVLIDVDTRDAIEGSSAFSYRTAGNFSLKGFERRVRLSRVRRVEAAVTQGRHDAGA